MHGIVSRKSTWTCRSPRSDWLRRDHVCRSGTALLAAVWVALSERLPIRQIGMANDRDRICIGRLFAWHLRSYQAGNNDFLELSCRAGLPPTLDCVSPFDHHPHGWCLELGTYLVVGIITITKFSDAGAYFAAIAWVNVNFARTLVHGRRRRFDRRNDRRNNCQLGLLWYLCSANIH